MRGSGGEHAWLLGGMHGYWGGMHGCWGGGGGGAAYMVLEGACSAPGGVHGCWGACMVARGACVVAGGHAWLLRGVCVVARGVCMVAGGHAWLQGGMCGCCGGHAWLLGGVHGCWGGVSYWNAFLLTIVLSLTDKIPWILKRRMHWWIQGGAKDERPLGIQLFTFSSRYSKKNGTNMVMLTVHVNRPLASLNISESATKKDISETNCLI